MLVPKSIVAVACIILGVSATTAAAETRPNAADAGDVVVVDPFNVNREIRDGDSTSLFTLRLPDGAACQGDSANDDWRVQSYIVPANTDISSLRYGAMRPEGDPNYQSLRYPDGFVFTMENTNPNAGPGMPGVILAIPPLTLAGIRSGSLEPGEYKMGIACTEPSWYVKRYWDVDVVLEAAPDVDPGGLRWRVAERSAPVSNSSASNGSPWFLALALLVVAVSAALFLRRRTQGSHRPPQKEAI